MNKTKRSILIYLTSAFFIVLGVLANIAELAQIILPRVDRLLLLGICSLIATTIIIGKLLADFADSLKLPPLIHTKFEVAFSSPDRIGDEDLQRLTQITKAAVVLLLVEQTDSGIWAWSYLYRRVVSNEGISIARGTFTSIPQVVTAIFSLIEKDDNEFIDFFTGKILATLERSYYKSTGQFLRRYGLGQGGMVPEFEPERHTAGGLLSKILLGEISTSDMICFQYLTSLNKPHGAWDKAIISRTFTHIIYNKGFAWQNRVKAYLHRNRLIDQLIADAHSAGNPSLTWSYSYAYGRDATNQWDSIWALYPLFSDSLLSKSRKRSLQEILHNLIQSYIIAAPDEFSMLPAKIDQQDFNGSGQYAFSTVLAPLVYKTFEIFSFIKIPKDKSYSSKTLKRVLKNYDKVIINPSLPIDDDPMNIEGFFAWAGFCLTAAAFGVSFDKSLTASIKKLVKELRLIDPKQFDAQDRLLEYINQLLLKYDLVPSEYATPLAEAISNILNYREVVLASH